MFEATEAGLLLPAVTELDAAAFVSEGHCPHCGEQLVPGAHGRLYGWCTFCDLGWSTLGSGPRLSLQTWFADGGYGPLAPRREESTPCNWTSVTPRSWSS